MTGIAAAQAEVVAAAERQRCPLPDRRAFPEEFPEGLKPRLRMFLSVDIVGSTPYNQTRRVWRPEIVSFYGKFDYTLQTHYAAFCKNRGVSLPAPEFWKSNGDELLYVCELRSLAHAQSVLRVWLAALASYRSQRDEAGRGLDVKSTAWIGLFPAPNMEVFFHRGALPGDTRDPLLVQADLREEWYANPANPSITRDFLGPSIDTGFRLTSWASPSRLVISVDLAFLLTDPHARQLRPLTLHQSGRDKLKGVIGNQPYPTIWIPVGEQATHPSRGPISTDPAAIRTACEAIIEQNHLSIIPLYLAGARHEDFDWVPPYMLDRVLRHWREEEHYRTEVTKVVLI